MQSPVNPHCVEIFKLLVAEVADEVDFSCFRILGKLVAICKQTLHISNLASLF